MCNYEGCYKNDNDKNGWLSNENNGSNEHGSIYSKQRSIHIDYSLTLDFMKYLCIIQFLIALNTQYILRTDPLRGLTLFAAGAGASRPPQ